MKYSSLLAELELKKLCDKRICVIGDLIVDYYRILKDVRKSPEAPVVIFHPITEEYKAGGAFNVVENLKALGAGSVRLITAIGNDNYTTKLAGLIQDHGIENVIFFQDNRLTTVKERIVTRRQQICRIDVQSNEPIHVSTAEAILSLDRTKEYIENADAIVFSDYDHGVCIPELISPILEIAKAKGIPAIVDSKSRDTLSKYRGSTIVLPNMDEARMMTKMDDFEDEDVAKFLMTNMKLEAAAVTLGPRGIMLATRASEPKIFPPLDQNINSEVVDVTGAGDTVAAMVAAGLTLGLQYWQIMRLANVAAGVKVQKRGVATVTPAEIIAAIEAHDIELEFENGRYQDNQTGS